MTQPDLSNMFTLPPSRARLRPHEAAFVAEHVRRQSSKDRVLARLQDGPATGDELDAIGGRRFGARILELRQAGWDIVREPITLKLHRYTLLGRVPVQGAL